MLSLVPEFLLSICCLGFILQDRNKHMYMYVCMYIGVYEYMHMYICMYISMYVCIMYLIPGNLFHMYEVEFSQRTVAILMSVI